MNAKKEFKQKLIQLISSTDLTWGDIQTIKRVLEIAQIRLRNQDNFPEGTRVVAKGTYNCGNGRVLGGSCGTVRKVMGVGSLEVVFDNGVEILLAEWHVKRID